MRAVKFLSLSTIVLAMSSFAARADVNVVTSIKPVHSLVSGVMEGVGKPTLIIDGAASPHTYSMKPSQAAALQEADVVFWIGHELEAFLEKPLESLGSKAKSVELIDAEALVKLEVREGGAFEAHDDDHGDHHDEKKEAAHKDDDHHDEKKEAAHKDEGAHKDDHHGHHGADAHIWLDPMNAKAIIAKIAATLSAADPSNSERYAKNAADMTKSLDALVAEIDSDLATVRGKGFIVFHDAYQYFEKRFKLNASGSITVSPEVMPGAKRITELRAKIKDTGVGCVFAEPQFEPKLVQTVIEGTPAKSGVLDPLGASLENGKSLYFDLLRNMALSFKTCLS